ncbi:PREDICTED: roundabout homolog 4 [Nanorana parkeri]|uniref:roundabout homolog 4 n=1 Tax=Nanorana parkeri TaxID=125878 RepID=UPI0008546DB2|nr:PREDICTED: roundabout homolog 4 [Nanorana parkeri]
MFLMVLFVSCVFLPLGWGTQVNYCHCGQALKAGGHDLLTSRRHPRHLHHHRPKRRHRVRGPKSRLNEFAPRIIEHPSDTVVRRDQPVTMNCRAEGNPEPSIEWYHNGLKVNFSNFHGSLIHDGSIFFYQIKGKSNEGIYACLAQNLLGVAISRNASLTIAGDKDSNNKDFEDNKDSNNKDYEDNNDSNNKEYEDNNDSNNKDYEDNKDSNNKDYEGELQSDEKELTDVPGINVQSSSDPIERDKSGAANTEKAKMTSPNNLHQLFITMHRSCCTDAGLNRLVQVLSLRRKQEVTCLPESAHQSITLPSQVSAGKLSIGRTQRSDSGVYVCIAANHAGEKTSRPAQITVLEPLLFTNKPADVVTKAGSTVQFLCGAQGVPRPVIQWSKEQGALPTGRYAITNENTLSLQRVTVQDSGKYICTARNQVDTVSVNAQLVVEDPLDTGQTDRQKDVLQELAAVRVYLDSVTVQNSSSVQLQWKASFLSQNTEGYVVFYRPHLPPNSEWIKWRSVPLTENSATIPSLGRGQRYEFKVRPYGRGTFGTDSNVKHVQIPEGASPLAGRHCGSGSLWPYPSNEQTSGVGLRPPAHAQSAVESRWGSHTHRSLRYIGGHGNRGRCKIGTRPLLVSAHWNDIVFQIWCFGNETLHQANWTVDPETRRLEIAMLPAGVTYQIQVAAIYDVGVGRPSQPKYIFIDSPEVEEETASDQIPLDLILQVIKHPAFIATVGGTVWIILMVAVVYLCQRHAKPYSSKKHSGERLYRFASEDTIIKHRMDTSDSPWLSNTWKSASCSRNYSSTTSVNSQLLWMESKDASDFHKSTISFERKSDTSRSQIIPLVPDTGSMYGALYVDLPGKEMTTFQCPLPTRLPGMGIRVKSTTSPGLLDHSLFPRCSNPGSASNLTHGGSRNRIPRKPVLPVPPSVALKEPWSQNCKRELHHVNSAPLSPCSQAADQSGSVPSVKSLDGAPSGKVEYAKVMKTLSSPKILQYTTSLKFMDFLPYTLSLPPPPVPPPDEESAPETQAKIIPGRSSYSKTKQDNNHKQPNIARKKTPPDSLHFSHTAPITLSVSDDHVLTPDDVAHYLELSERGDKSRHPSDSDSTLPRPFSTSNTYGYICSPLPSELTEEAEAADEDDDDLELAEVSSLKSYRKYCETPTSSISDYESSMAGSLVNGWGSVSEDNYTSARCSMVSSSDGSFLMDASFAKALAVAVDSFCLGMTQSEATDRLRFYADFSPSASPLDGALAPQNQGDGTDQNRKAKVNPLPVLDWNIDWMDEMEAKYNQRSQTRAMYPFSKKMEQFK